MVELRVTDPCDPMTVVRLKLSQGALGITDIYNDGRWVQRALWSMFAGFDFEPVAGPLSEELAVQFHTLVNKRSRHESTTTPKPSRHR